MNKRKVIAAHVKIEKSKSAGFFLEALLLQYHLNAGILKFISTKLDADQATRDLKPKEILNSLIATVNSKPQSKTIISKKNLKALKPWLGKMDSFFKILKIKNPSGAKPLLTESEKIFALLNMSLAKLFIGK